MKRSLRTSMQNVLEARGTTRKGGAVIVVVLALMAMLAFLGIFFYDFVQVESDTAQNFLSAQPEFSGIDPESVINGAMSQVVSHTNLNDHPSSVLEGGKEPLLAKIFGTMDTNGRPRDYEMRNGRGLYYLPTSAGGDEPFKYTGNDSAPTVSTHVAEDAGTIFGFVINRSRAANDGNTFSSTAHEYEPDVDYTYPDLNGMFLGYDYIQVERDPNGNGVLDSGEAPYDLNKDGNFTEDDNNDGTLSADEDVNGNGVIDPDMVRYIKPSFMDIGLLSRLRPDTTTWYTDPLTKKWVFRPHKSHMIPGTTFARFDAANFPKLDGSALKLGLWTGHGVDYSGLDADADNDGFLDSIYIDLDLPVQELKLENRKLVPMAFFKIEDLNGLIDLNSAGNIPDLVLKNRAGSVDLFTDVYGYEVNSQYRPIHYSHYGATRAEINPMWALFANPVVSYVQGQRFPWDCAFYRTSLTTAFGPETSHPPLPQYPSADTRPRIRMQNTELAMLLLGSAATMHQSINSSFVFTNTEDDLQGRFGDRNRIPSTSTGQFAAPGTPDVDDDANEGTDLNQNGTVDTASPLPYGVHPSDPAGSGSINVQHPSGARTLGTLASVPTGMSFPTYQGNWQGQANPPISYQTGGLGLVAGTADFRIDDPAEVNRYSASNTERDNLFKPYETAALHLSEYDASKTALFSRVRQLAPFNFNMNEYARDIRRQFTTESWNRREFSFPYNPTRNWEFSHADPVAANTYRFPPQFGSITPSQHESGSIIDLDPFRPVVRRLLTTRSYQGAAGNAPLRNRANFPQLPLELNRVLIEPSSPTTAQQAFDSLGNPRFRELTPHANFTTYTPPQNPTPVKIPSVVHQNGLSNAETEAGYATLYPNNYPTGSPNQHPVKRFTDRGTDALVQEWWARQDRQSLARDIYVLLVTLCAPGNSGTNSTNSAISEEIAKEMAQFAVNYVDAFDSDDVITRFEYDINLSNGWADTASDMRTVLGVESQRLAFSEALWIQQNKASSDVSDTWHDESDGYHEFLYLELRNPTPIPVGLTRQTWRILRLDPDNNTLPHTASITFKSTQTVNSGSTFVISMHDGNLKAQGQAASSDFYSKFDPTGMAMPTTFKVIVPATGPDATPAAPMSMTPAVIPPSLCNLDLYQQPAIPAASQEFTLETLTPPPAAPGVPGFLYFSPDTPDPAVRMTLLLQRRQHLATDNKVELTDADWIDVDIVEIDPHVLALNSNTDLLTELPKIKSGERPLPLNRPRTEQDSSAVALHSSLPVATAVAAAGNPSFHTIDEITAATRLNSTSNAGAVASLWQPHHDRDFTSVYELLSVPLVDPYYLLESIREQGTTVDSLAGRISGWVRRTGTTEEVLYAAARRFLPDRDTTPPVNAIPGTGVTRRPHDRARPDYSTGVIPWGRILNFVALPDPTDRLQQTINPNLTRSRTYGQINVNMVRTPPVLEGLIDDSTDKDPADNSSSKSIVANSPFLQDRRDTSRLWWEWFKGLRDGHPLGGISSWNPVSSTVARPFRPQGLFHVGLTPVTEVPADGNEHTLLRRQFNAYPAGAAEDAIGLFEARTQADYYTATPTPGAGPNLVDLHTRNRLLQKVANNATTRSHCFAIWCGVDFFEGTEVATGKFQVGKKASDVPTARWFFVVDMSRLEDAYDTASLNSTTTPAFDWRKFVIYRQRLE